MFQPSPASTLGGIHYVENPYRGSILTDRRDLIQSAVLLPEL